MLLGDDFLLKKENALYPNYISACIATTCARPLAYHGHGFHKNNWRPCKNHKKPNKQLFVLF